MCRMGRIILTRLLVGGGLMVWMNTECLKDFKGYQNRKQTDFG